MCVSSAAPSPSELPSFVGAKPFRTSSSRGSAATACPAAESGGLCLLRGRRACEVPPSPCAPASRLGLGPLGARWTPRMGAPLAESRAWPRGLTALSPGGARPRGGWCSPPGRPGALLGVAVPVVIGLLVWRASPGCWPPPPGARRATAACAWRPPDTLLSGQPYRSPRAALPASWSGLKVSSAGPSGCLSVSARGLRREPHRDAHRAGLPRLCLGPVPSSPAAPPAASQGCWPGALSTLGALPGGH